MGSKRQVMVGGVAVGGGAPVSVQTMANVDPHDAAALVAQAESCAALGCDIFRLTVPDVEAAKVLGEVKRTLVGKGIDMPLVADIHFDYRCALAAIEHGTDALRLNPGNIGGRERVQAVARAAKAAKTPIRIGVNLGSLEKGLEEKVERVGGGGKDNKRTTTRLESGVEDNKRTTTRLESGVEDNKRTTIRLEGGRLSVAEALCESAMGHLKLLEDEGFYDVVISAKASNVADTLATYRLLAERTDCPLHLGVTEAGTFLPGTVRNSVALGILLSEGIGDTIRVSLTDKPEKEVRVGMEILRALGAKPAGPAITSCPTCGRTKVGLFRVAEEVELELEKAWRREGQRPRTPRQQAYDNKERQRAYDNKIELGESRVFPHVAVMGCVVNGPGEAKGADIALCGGDGEFLLYVKGKVVGKVSEADAVRKVMEYVQISR